MLNIFTLQKLVNFFYEQPDFLLTCKELFSAH
jgi:hypothetical protein